MKMTDFCAEAISEELLLDKHKHLVELYMKRFNNEWKVGSAEDRNEFKAYFDRDITKDMWKFWKITIVKAETVFPNCKCNILNKKTYFGCYVVSALKKCFDSV